MLINAVMEFRVEENPENWITEGSIFADNEEYICCAEGEDFFVFFKAADMSDQLLIIKPDWSTNLDPDGGLTFMTRNVISFIDSLVSEKTYL